MQASTALFRPGERCKESGIFSVQHYQHRMPHNVFIRQGALFPACKRCGDRVLYSAFLTVHELSEDVDLGESATAAAAD